MSDVASSVLRLHRMRDTQRFAGVFVVEVAEPVRGTSAGVVPTVSEVMGPSVSRW